MFMVVSSYIGYICTGRKGIDKEQISPSRCLGVKKVNDSFPRKKL